MEQALDGVKVIDLGHYIAGPYCSKLLADCGAEVIKVERPHLGDGSRRLGPFPGDVPHLEKSGLFLYLNSNKRGLTLNLKTDEGRQVFKELVKGADILVENFRPGVMARLGLSYEVLQVINPGLVMTSITNFGQTGPYRDFEATEIILQGMGGLMSVTGDRDKAPLKYSLNQAQYFAAASAAVATLTAFYMAEATGVGQHADASIVETLAGSYHGVTAQYPYTGTVSRRGSNDMYPCKDGYIAPYIGERVTWDFYVNFLGAPELAGERFQTMRQRQIHEAEVERGLERALAARGRYDWLFDAQARDMAFGAMQTMEDLAACPQLGARDYLMTVDHPEAGPHVYPGRPYSMTESPYSVRLPAPGLGEHNQQVLGELGYSAGEIARLQAVGAI